MPAPDGPTPIPPSTPFVGVAVYGLVVVGVIVVGVVVVEGVVVEGVVVDGVVVTGVVPVPVPVPAVLCEEKKKRSKIHQVNLKNQKSRSKHILKT
jgi:hypothetical protein